MAINATTKALLDDVLLWCGAWGIGDTPVTADENLALSQFVSLCKEWNDDADLALRVPENKSLVTGDQTIEFGVGTGKWNTDVPVVLLQAKMKIGTIEYSLHVASDSEQNAWQDTSTSGWPDSIYFNGSALVLNCPLSADGTLYITSIKALLHDESTGEWHAAAAAYKNAFELSMRLRLDGFYEKKAGQLDIAMAERAKTLIKRKNAGAAPILQPMITLL